MPPPDSPAVWLLRTILPESRAPAPGVPVTLLDDNGNASGYWVSDTAGLVSIPRGTVSRLRLRVGLRSETPIDLDTDALAREIVELEAPRSLVPSLRSRAAPPPSSPAPVPIDLPGHVLHFTRLALLPVPRTPERPQLPPAGGHDLLATADTGGTGGTGLRYGALVEVEQYWQPLGQIAGDLVYSVAVPPGDQAQVGVVDERWLTAGGGAPRPLEVLARLIAAPGIVPPDSDRSAALPLEPLTLTPSAGPAGGLSVAALDTIHYLNERAVRMSQVLRRRPLRVIEGIAERTLRNSTTDRAVSYHFFEPLERYRVMARAARVRPALLVPFHLPTLATRGMVRQHGHLLRRALLDRSLEAALDRLIVPPSRPSMAAPAAAAPVSELRLIVERAPGEAEQATDLRRIWCFLHAGTTRYAVHFFPSDAVAGVDAPTATPHWIGAIRLADFHDRPLEYPAALSLQNGSPALLRFREVHIEGRAASRWVRLHTVRDLVLPPQSQVPLAGHAELGATLPEGADPEEARLLAHIAINSAYYAAAVIAGGDPAVRYLALAAVRDAAGYALADVCENAVVGVVGNWLAFPLRSPEFAPPGLRAAVEQYATRPARFPEETVVAIPVPGLWLTVQGAEAAGGAEARRELADPDLGPRSVLHRPATRRR